MIRWFRDYLFGTNCAVYVACAMSGENKPEMVARARRVCEILAEESLTPISPVIEEQVKEEPGKLINSDKPRLKGFWSRDKHIIVWMSHVVFWDHAEKHSFGATREYGLNRYCIWKPTVIYVAPGTPTSVAEWEDDAIFTSVHEAAKFIRETWGSRWNRWTWRTKMLNRTLPGWLVRQVAAWR